MFRHPHNELAIANFIQHSSAPIFAKLSRGDASSVYLDLKQKTGILVPIPGSTNSFHIDYSWRKDWHRIKAMYPGIETAKVTWRSLSIMSKMGDIPPEAINNASTEFRGFVPKALNDIVTINPHKLEDSRRIRTISEAQYKHLRSFVPQCGVVTKVDGSTILTSWKRPGSNTYAIYNVPIHLLIKVPETFRSFALTVDKPEKQEEKKQVFSGNKKQAKYKVGDVVRGTNSAKDKNYTGLVGIVRGVHEEDKNYTTDWYYDVDWNTLITRAQLLCEGEPTELKLQTRMREWDLDGFNLGITSMPQLAIYEAQGNRDSLWSCRHQADCVVETKTYPNLDNDGQMIFPIQVADKKFKVRHYELDYLYDRERVLEVLNHTRWTTLAYEPYNDETWAFLYIGLDDDLTIHYRFKLGRITNTPSMKKKFEKFMMNIAHPWQIHRYLQPKSLGRFYDIVEAREYFDMAVPNFEYLETQDA